MVRAGLKPKTLRACTGMVVLAWSLQATTAGAQPSQASLAVTRGVGAETCADTSELEALVRAASGGAVLVAKGASALHIDVRIERVEAGLRGVIELTGARRGTRTLDDPGPACDVLSQGLAVTIAVLLDTGDGEPTAPIPTPPVPERKPSSTPATPAPDVGTARPAEEPGPGVPVTFTVGTYYDFGTADGSAAGLVAAAELVVPIVTFGAAFLTLPHAPRDRGPDHVYRFFGGRARVCTREPYLELFGASICAGLLAGTRILEVPRVDEEVSGAFVAATFSLEVSRRIVGPFGAYADLNLSIPAFREELLLTIEKVKLTPNEEPVTFQMGAGFRFWIAK
jgi:hypothetical protein